jgi:uncharacterized membrane protein
MNAAQTHLMLNHVPVLVPFLAALLVIVGMAHRSQPILRVALGLLAFAALIAVPVYLTGEPVEDAVKGAPGVAEQQINLHEDSALVSLILLCALGLTAGLGLARYRRRPVPRGMSVVILVASVIVAIQIAWTAHLGGLIRHTELQGGSAVQAPPAPVDGDD